MGDFKTQRNKNGASQAAAHRNTGGSGGGFYLEDNRSKSVLQRKENNTGLPDDLKTGVENLSGYSMDDVKVHYNSDQPAQLNAHAFAQGTDIHLASGQEQHLPHEAWHVVQQKQGRVQPTKQLKKSIDINDDEDLEQEADIMGDKSLESGIGTLQMKSLGGTIQFGNSPSAPKAEDDDSDDDGAFVPQEQEETSSVTGLTRTESLRIAQRGWEAKETEARDRLNALMEEQKNGDERRDELRTELNVQMAETVGSDIGSALAGGGVPGIGQDPMEMHGEMKTLEKRGEMEDEIKASQERDTQIDREFEEAKEQIAQAREYQIEIERRLSESGSKDEE